MMSVDNRRKLHRRLDPFVLYTDGDTALWYVTPKQWLVVFSTMMSSRKRWCDLLATSDFI